MVKELANRLRDELERRKLKNSSYSLRAFARDLEVSPAYLSLILSQKIEVKSDKFELIVSKLFSDQKEKSRWINQFNDLPNRFFYKGEIPDYKEIPTNTVQVTWAHYAVLELLHVSTFKSDIEWMDDQLGIGQQRLEEILADLMKLGAIIEEDNQLKAQQVSFTNINETRTSVYLINGSYSFLK